MQDETAKSETPTVAPAEAPKPDQKKGSNAREEQGTERRQQPKQPDKPQNEPKEQNKKLQPGGNRSRNQN